MELYDAIYISIEFHYTWIHSSPVQSRHFELVTGDTALVFLRNVPKHKNKTVTEIYLAVGFNSKSAFYTFFKKFENTTPSKFKEMNQLK